MPSVAVCVCTCGRPRQLDHLLATLERLEPGGLGQGDAMLLVIDNRPDGSTATICAARRDRLPIPLVLVDEPRPGISFARNRAVAEALQRGAGLIAFIDDDDEPSPDWLWRLLAVWRAGGADMVFGTWRLGASSLPPLLARVRFFEPIRIESRNPYGLPGWAGTFNVLLTRRLVEGLACEGPLFRPEFAFTGGGDTDLFIRAHLAGFSHAVAADSVVYRRWEADRMTLWGVMRRAFKTGCTHAQLAAAHQSAAGLARLRARAVRRLAALTMRLPWRLGRSPTMARLLVQASQHAGELYGALGGRFAYYRPR